MTFSDSITYRQVLFLYRPISALCFMFDIAAYQHSRCHKICRYQTVVVGQILGEVTIRTSHVAAYPYQNLSQIPDRQQNFCHFPIMDFYRLIYASTSNSYELIVSRAAIHDQSNLTFYLALAALACGACDQERGSLFDSCLSSQYGRAVRSELCFRKAVLFSVRNFEVDTCCWMSSYRYTMEPTRASAWYLSLSERYWDFGNHSWITDGSNSPWKQLMWILQYCIFLQGMHCNRSFIVLTTTFKRIVLANTSWFLRQFGFARYTHMTNRHLTIRHAIEFHRWEKLFTFVCL